MKTTLDLDDDLLARAKALAARERTSAHHADRGRPAPALAPARTEPPTRGATGRVPGSGGLVEGIDPLSNRSLTEAADDDA